MNERNTKDFNWTMNTDHLGKWSYDAAQLSVLMDIRDELKTLNKVFACHNALAIPDLLRAIKLNTKPKRKLRKKAA